jgi:hypothetical protein
MKAIKTLSLALAAMLILSFSCFAADSTAQFASTKPVIDAVIDEIWAKTPAQEGTVPGDNWTDGCANGYTKILWDEDYVYFLAVITDSTLDVDHESTSNSVDFWMSETNSQDPDGFNAEGDWHLAVGSYGAASYYIGNEALPGAAEYETAVDGNTYIIEARIPWQTAGFNAATGHVIGYNVSINDDWEDDATRDAWISWQDYNGAPYWGNTAALNTVELTGEMILDTQAPETDAPADEPEAEAETPAPETAPATSGTPIAAVLAAILALGACAVVGKKRRI